MRAFGLLSTLALSKCWAEVLEESSLLQINHLDLKGESEADIECRLHGRCKTHTTTTTTCETTTPPELPAIGICTITGDPHIKPFDSATTNVNYFYNGDYYLVKSDFLVVQARYWSTLATGKATVKGLAIGGNIMAGSVLTIEPQNGAIKLDGEVVNLAETGTVSVGSGTLTSSADAGAQKKGPLLTLRFGSDDVTIKVKRLGQNLNVVIEMRPEPGQDGHCGNFNGDVMDDDLKSIKGRMGTPLRYGETMFPIMTAHLRGCAPKELGQKNIGKVFGKNMNSHECNMMCSQEGSAWMVVMDGICSCAASVPSVVASAECEASCVDSSVADIGFCAYEMAKPAAIEANKCLLDEAQTVKACTAAFQAQSGTTPEQAAASILSCKVDACATGDLTGTLAYLQDWGSVEQQEKRKLRAQAKKERALSETQKKEKRAKRRASHKKKREQTKLQEADKKAARKKRQAAEVLKKAARAKRKAAEVVKKQVFADKTSAKKAAEFVNKAKHAAKKAATEVAAKERKAALTERKTKAVKQREDKQKKTAERRKQLTEKKTKRVEQLDKKKAR